MKTRQ